VINFVVLLVDAKQAQGFLSFFKAIPHVSLLLFSYPICGIEICEIFVEVLVVCLVARKMEQKEKEVKFVCAF
jgi:hypothetical protein